MGKLVFAAEPSNGCYVTSLCDITQVAPMSRGNSGRIVIEIEPGLKNELYQALMKDGTNLKSWFLQNVQVFLANKDQLALELESEEPIERRQA